MNSQGYQPHIIDPLNEALYQNILLMHSQNVLANPNRSNSRKDLLMRRFFALVKQHSINERSIDFYASELCVSSGYLSIIVKRESGHSVMYWINRSLIYRAKIALVYTDKTINELTDDLNFSTPSFFCKFFKNATGLTPSQYRRERSDL